VQQNADRSEVRPGQPLLAKRNGALRHLAIIYERGGNSRLLRTAIAQVVEILVIEGENESVLTVAVRDLENEDRVVIVFCPSGDLRGIDSVELEHQLGEFVEEPVFPRHEDKGLPVGGLFQFGGELANFRIAVGGVDRELAADGGGLDGDKGTEVVELASVDLLRRIRCKDEGGASVLGK
jgi:hypothetical protein